MAKTFSASQPDERARHGLFLAFQYPIEIPGVTNANFLRAALQARLPEGEELEATDYYAKLYEKMDLLEMDRTFTSRSVNEGFSGGEKKRNEILQMAMLEPKYAVLDETDSGLDIDALKIVAHGVNALRGPERRRPPHHALPAPARLHCARPRARHGRGAHRPQRRTRARPRTGRKGLRLGAATTSRNRRSPNGRTLWSAKLSPLEIDRNAGNFAYPETHTYDAGIGLTEKTRSTTSRTSRTIRIGCANSASTRSRLS